MHATPAARRWGRWLKACALGSLPAAGACCVRCICTELWGHGWLVLWEAWCLCHGGAAACAGVQQQEPQCCQLHCSLKPLHIPLPTHAIPHNHHHHNYYYNNNDPPTHMLCCDTLQLRRLRPPPPLRRRPQGARGRGAGAPARPLRLRGRRRRQRARPQPQPQPGQAAQPQPEQVGAAVSGTGSGRSRSRWAGAEISREGGCPGEVREGRAPGLDCSMQGVLCTWRCMWACVPGAQTATWHYMACSLGTWRCSLSRPAGTAATEL